MRIALTALVLLLAACGGGDTAPGAAISIADALATDSEEPVLVEGFLRASGDEVRLCSAVLESYPPQCGEPSLLVGGLDLSQVPDLERERDVAWAEGIQLLGVVEDGVLKVSENAAT